MTGVTSGAGVTAPWRSFEFNLSFKCCPIFNYLCSELFLSLFSDDELSLLFLNIEYAASNLHCKQ